MRRTVKTLPPQKKPSRYRPLKWVVEMLATADGIAGDGYAVASREYPIGQSARKTAMRLRYRHPNYEFATRGGVIYCRRKPTKGAK